MKTSELKRIIKETILKEMRPGTKEKPGTKEPGIKEPGPKEPKRRTLQPPKEVPKTVPKAEGLKENDKDMVKKIVQKYKGFKK